MLKQIAYLLTFVVLLACIEVAAGQYEDVRCKCVCPPKPGNGTDSSRKIIVKSFNDPKECECEKVVYPSMKSLCPKCECKWQRRNTTTIKVVVILIICIVSLLFLYMLFLLCLDPLMSRRPKSYLEQHNEEDTQSIHRPTDESSARVRHGAIITRVRHEVHRVRDEQERWKGTVSEQRKNIFDRHTMLN